jgi:hypothetical protein
MWIWMMWDYCMNSETFGAVIPRERIFRAGLHGRMFDGKIPREQFAYQGGLRERQPRTDGI